MDPYLVWIRLKLPAEELGPLVKEFAGQAKFEQWNDRHGEPPWLDQVAVIYANELLDHVLMAKMPNLKWVHAANSATFSALLFEKASPIIPIYHGG